MDCDFSHDPADVPRLIAAAEAGADLVLGSRYVPGGSIPNWGARAALHLARRQHLRAGLAPEPAPRPDRRLQVLPAARARDDRPRRDRLEGLRVPDRDDLPRRPRRLPGRRGADHVLGPRARPLEDEPRDRRSRRSGRCRCCGSARSRAGCSLAVDARGHRRELRARTSSGPSGRSWSTSGRRGAGRARPSTPIIEELAGETDEVEFVKLDIDDEPGRRVPLRRAFDPDGDPLRRAARRPRP